MMRNRGTIKSASWAEFPMFVILVIGKGGWSDRDRGSRYYRNDS